MKKHIIRIFILLAITTIVNAQSVDKAKFDKYIQSAYDKFQPAGLAVAIVKDNKIVYEKNIGHLNATDPKPITNKSLFNIASCSKAFTAAAMAKLVEQGKVKWSTKVKEILPEFELADIYITNQLTVEDLLCHRAGYETFDGDLLWYGSDYTDEEVMAHLKYQPITKNFRKDFGYQNNMYTVAGIVIKKLSGVPWAEFIQKEILNPLEMNGTRPSDSELQKTDEITTPHVGKNTMMNYVYGSGKPAASIHSSTSELSHWLNMWLNKGKYNGKEIFKESTLNYLVQMQTQLRIGNKDLKNKTHFKGYALGWFVNDDNGQLVVEHDGGMPGYISKVGMLPELGYGYIILNNGMDGYINNSVKDLIFTALINKKDNDVVKNLEAAYKSKLQNDSTDKANIAAKIKNKILNTQPITKLENFIGTYQDKSWGIVEMKLQDGQLYFDMTRSPSIFKSKLAHFQNNSFEVNFNDLSMNKGYINFETDSDNKIKGFKIDLESGDFWFYKLNFEKIK
jgi:CubicO group peptidase (beta-lactamase class C family)